MLGYGHLDHALRNKTDKSIPDSMTIGRVIDTNDPQQMGRIRVFCPAYGDKEEMTIGNIPWAMYVSPLGGIVNSGTRGHTKSPATGPVAYGMWNIPKLGSYVLVGTIDGDKSKRFYAGCIQPQYMTHTMPHGRYDWDNSDSTGNPDGPLDTNEDPIEPLYSNFQQHFGGNTNPEWKTRGADMQVAGITNLHVQSKFDSPGTTVADHNWGQSTTVQSEDGSTRTIDGIGYGIDQQRPGDVYDDTGGYNYDSLIYSWTTPGFHSISMDDRHDNNRVRIRTTSGHQIIMDDTNERMYVSTAGGETWIEIDAVGNIDIYASKNVSTHAGGDINFTAGKAFRVQAEDIHLQTSNDFRINSSNDTSIIANNIRAEATTDVFLQSGFTMHLKSLDETFIESAEPMHIKTGSTLHLQSGSQMNLKTDSGDIVAQASANIHLNGPSANAADSADAAEALFAYAPSRVPDHEPWPRVFTDPGSADNDTAANTATPELGATDSNVGKGGRGETYPRNPLWKR